MSTTTSGNNGEHGGKCGARRLKSDDLCTQPAGWGTDHPGIGRCKLHGGSSPTHVKYARRIMAEREATAFGGRLDITAPEALLELVQTKAAEVVYWDQRVQLLEDSERAGMLDAKIETGEERGEPKYVQTTQVGPHIYVTMLHKAQDQLATYSAAAIRAGVDKAIIEVATMQAAWLIPVVLRAIELGQHTPAGDPQDMARELLEGGMQ